MAVTGLLNGKLYKKTNRDEVYYFDQNTLRHIQSIHTLHGVFSGPIKESWEIDAWIDTAKRGEPIGPDSFLVHMLFNTPYFLDSNGVTMSKREINVKVLAACSFRNYFQEDRLREQVMSLSDGPCIGVGFDDDGNQLPS